jgi:serralysin
MTDEGKWDMLNKSIYAHVFAAVAALAIATGTPASAQDRFALASYQWDGNLNTIVGGTGLVATEFTPGGDAEARAMVLDSSFRLVVAGSADGQFAVARYNSNGTLDASFGIGGRVVTSFGSDPFTTAKGVAIDSLGRIVVVGRALNTFALARYEPDGDLDVTFGNQGTILMDFGRGMLSAEANAVAIDGQGRIVVAGRALLDSAGVPDGVFALARYLPSGALDTSFGTFGRVISNFYPTDPSLDPYAGYTTFNWEEANAIAIDGAGRILVAGQSVFGLSFLYQHTYSAQAVVIRYTASGMNDAGFGATSNLGLHYSSVFWASSQAPDPLNLATASALTVDYTGHIVVAGKEWDGSRTRFAVARLNQNGSPDSTFDADGNGDGKITTSWCSWGGCAPSGAAAMTVGLGKIILAGFVDYGYLANGGKVFAMARYNWDGSLDTTFGGGDGKVTTDFACYGSEEANAVLLRAASPFAPPKIYVAGRAAGDPCQ